MGRQRNRVTAKGKGSRVRTLVVPLTLVVFLAPAAYGSPTASDELLETLFGTWSWVQATGGIAGMTRTPVSEGYTRTLTFTRPNQVKMLRDGVPEVTSIFEFVSPIANGSAQRSCSTTDPSLALTNSGWRSPRLVTRFSPIRAVTTSYTNGVGSSKP